MMGTSKLKPVVYLDQLLGAAHSKCWSKYAFQSFCARNLKKEVKARNLMQNLEKNGFSKFAPECWSRDLVPLKINT